MSAPSVEPAATAARKQSITASKFCASNVFRRLLRLGADVYSLSNAVADRPRRASRSGAAHALDELRPMLLGEAPLDARPSVTNVFAGSQSPVRTSAGPTFTNGSGKSMITYASGLSATICSASEL